MQQHFFDTTRMEPCTFNLVSDGTQRCLPLVDPYATFSSQFSDAQCPLLLRGWVEARQGVRRGGWLRALARHQRECTIPDWGSCDPASGFSVLSAARSTISSAIATSSVFRRSAFPDVATSFPRETLSPGVKSGTRNRRPAHPAVGVADATGTERTTREHPAVRDDRA